MYPGGVASMTGFYDVYHYFFMHGKAKEVALYGYTIILHDFVDMSRDDNGTHVVICCVADMDREFGSKHVFVVCKYISGWDMT